MSIPSARELAKLENLELVAAYNEIADSFPDGERPKHVARFESKDRGLRRVKELIQKLRLVEGQLDLLFRGGPIAAPSVCEPDPVETVIPHKCLGIHLSAKAAEKMTSAEIGDRIDGAVEQATHPRKRSRKPPADRNGVALAPLPCKVGSMAATLVDLLSRPQGAALDELAAATGSTTAEVKSRGLCWLLPYHGYGSRQDEGALHLVVPEGHAVPAHEE